MTWAGLSVEEIPEVGNLGNLLWQRPVGYSPIPVMMLNRLHAHTKNNTWIHSFNAPRNLLKCV